MSSSSANSNHLDSVESVATLSRWQRLQRQYHNISIRIKMFGILAFCILLMVGHDQFYVSLRSQIVSDDSPEDLSLDKVGFQLVVHAVGTIFSYTTKLLLSAAVGLAFVQVFWMRMRRESHTIPEIDAALSSKTNPFGFASLKAWRSMFLLAFIPALGFINIQILVFSTGSISLEFIDTNGNCEIFTVDLSNDDLVAVNNNTLSPKAQVRGFVTQAIMFDGSLSPAVFNSNTISYSLSFNAPDLDCTDITSTALSSQLLPPSSIDSPIPVWNTIYQGQSSTGGPPFSFITASRDLKLASDGVTIIAEDDSQVVQCVFYNATYSVAVNQTDSGIFESFTLNRTLNNPLVLGSQDDEDNGALNFVALADTFARILNGTVAYDPTTSEFNSDCSVIAYTKFVEDDPGIPWSLTEADMTVAIPQLMEQVGVSLLSDGLITETGSRPLSKIWSACMINALTFKYDAYDRTRLLLSYGAGLLGTALSVAFGCYAISVNGIEENIHFSRIVSSLVHPGMCANTDILQDPETKFKLEGEKGERGKFGMKVEKSV